ncbi:hypothetical protein V6N12_013123 [Hibiscus sabdariffa]|uniref:Uncharacterized protein n=1 Tax=Hibiscus sabdariffa TaxID=183260 RepID=A0ABR1ZHZ3_9ROSI
MGATASLPSTHVTTTRLAINSCHCAVPRADQIVPYGQSETVGSEEVRSSKGLPSILMGTEEIRGLIADENPPFTRAMLSGQPMATEHR